MRRLGTEGNQGFFVERPGLLAGLVVLALYVSLVPYRYLPLLLSDNWYIQAMVRYLPGGLVVGLGTLVILGRRSSHETTSGDPLLWPVLAMAGGDFLSAVAGVLPMASLAKSGYYLLTGPCLYLLVRECTKGDRRARLALMAVMAGASALSAVYGISEFLVGENWLFGPVFVHTNAAYSALVGQTAFGSRILGTVGHPVALGAYFLLSLPLGIYWSLHGSGLPGRAAGLAAVLVLIGALLLTFSRGAWLGAIATGLAYCAFGNRRMIAAFVATMVLVVSAVAMSDTLRDGTLSRDPYRQYVENYKSDARIHALGYTATIVAGDVLWGTGIGTYRLLARPLGSKLDTSDNMYTTRLAETGTIGLALLVYLLMTIGREYLRVWRVSGAPERQGTAGSAMLLFGGLVGFCVVMGTYDALYFPVTRIWFWMIVGIGMPDRAR